MVARGAGARYASEKGWVRGVRDAPLASIDSIGGAVARSSTAGSGSTTTAATGTSSGCR